MVELRTQERHATRRIAFNAQVQRAGPAARQRACRRGRHRGDHRCAIAVGKWGRPGPLCPQRTVKGSSSSSSTSSSHFFAVRGAEVVRKVGALVLPHGRPEAVAHTALLLLAPRHNRGLLGVRPASDCRSRCTLARKCPRRASPRAPRRASMVPPDALGGLFIAFRCHEHDVHAVRQGLILVPFRISVRRPVEIRRRRITSAPLGSW